MAMPIATGMPNAMLPKATTKESTLRGDWAPGMAPYTYAFEMETRKAIIVILTA
jgi:hypothetical protein